MHELFPDVGMILEAKDRNCFEISNRHAVGLSSFSESDEGRIWSVLDQSIEGQPMISENMPGAFHDATGDELCQVLCTILIVVVVFYLKG